MIDGIGGRPCGPHAVAAARTSNGDAARPEPAAVKPETRAALSRIARDLAASPPVDSAKVARLKASIDGGTYAIDADAIAARIVALETPFRG